MKTKSTSTNINLVTFTPRIVTLGLLAVLLQLSVLPMPTCGSEWAFQILHEFSYMGGGPSGPRDLIQGRDGDFYTTSSGGGSNNAGTVFRLAQGGVVTTLNSLGGTNGQYPAKGLIEGADGNFYGTTYQVENQAGGTIFQITPAGFLTTLHHFVCMNGEGISPICRLTQIPNGEIYGTTFSGGASGCSGNSAGTVFKITTNGVFTTVLSFNQTNGANPLCGLILGSDGDLYGNTMGGGGASGDAYGTIFRLTTNGVLTTLHTFDYTIDGGLPSGNLLQASDGNFYGTTEYGITNNFGTIFRMTPAGTLTTLVAFNGTNGSRPRGDLIQAGDGFIYGRTIDGGTYDKGTIFRLSTNGVLTTILDFNGTNGASPAAAMVIGRDGNLYGTTISGGSGEVGVAFRLVPQPLITYISCSNALLTLTWTSFAGGSYRIEETTNLTAASWTPISSPVTASNNVTTLSLTVGAGSHGFYRLALLP